MEDTHTPAVTRRVEVHFGLEERAIVVDIDGDSEADVGDAVVEALEARDVDDAVRHLRARIGSGATSVRLVRARQ
jgi:hypothetical protein